MELHTPKYVKVLQYVVMIIMALFMFFPIYWIFVNSLKTITGISAWPPEFFPKDPQWGNYVKVLENPNTILYLRNTLILVVLNTVGTLLTSSIVAYPLARMNFKGRGVVFAIILATMMVPSAALVIPQYLLFRNFGMLDSFWPLILPSFFAQPYNVFLFRQFFVSIPQCWMDAAVGRHSGKSSCRSVNRFSLPSASCLPASGGTNCSLRWYTSTPKTSSR